MNKQRKTSHILNVFQYDDATGIIGLNGAPVSGYGLYLTTNINDGSVGIDSSASINALYLLKNTTKQFEISYDTSGATKIFRLLPYQSGSFFQIGNPSNAANSNSDYVFISEATYGNVLIGPGIGNGTGNLTGATASIHKVQFNGAVFANNSIQATSFKITGGASTGFLKADGTVDAVTYLSGNQSITVSGDATGSGTTSIALTLANTTVTPGTYGSTTLVPVVTVDSKGRITSVTTAAISGSLTFTGDVTGTGTTGTSTGLTLAASGVTAGTYTKVTVDSKGRVTVGASATTTDIAEGTRLYYTDARVLAYLGANNYATQSYVSTQINNLVSGAPGLLDTLDELAQALGDDPNFATTTATSLGNRLRIDTASQGLNSTQQANGRTNLGLGTAALSATGDFVAFRTFGTAANSAVGDFVAFRTFGTAANNNTGDFALASHTHSIANVTGLQTALDGKQASLGFTPYNATNPSGYITGITSANVTTALGFTPYNSSNPAGYITSSSLSAYAPNNASFGDANALTTGGFFTAYNASNVPSGLNSLDMGMLNIPLWGGNSGGERYTMQLFANLDTNTNFYIRKFKYFGAVNQSTWYTLWHSGNLTNLNQLTNGPGYITSSALSSYLPLSGGTLSNTLNIGSGGSTNGSLLNVTGGVHNQVNITQGSTWGLLLGYCNEGSVSGYHGPNSAAIINVQDGPLHLGAGNTTVVRIVSTGVSILGNAVIHAGNYNSYAPTLTGGGASGTWGINISGTSAASTSTTFVSSPDGGRNPNTAPLPNTNPRSVSYNFATSGSVGGTGNYAGVMTYAPWDGTSASTGDSSYQLAFLNDTGINASGIPGLSIRNGINSSWNATWYRLLTSGNYNSYSPTLTGGGASGTWGINITGSAGSAGSSSSVSSSSSTGITSSYSTTIGATTPGLATYGINFAGSSIADNASGITWAWSGNAAQAGIYVQSSGSYGTKMYLATTDSFATGAKTSVSIDHVGTVLITRSYLQSDSSLRAPIFYDSQDTGYYADFNSTSNSAMRIRGGALYGPNPTWGAYLQVGGDGNTNAGAASVVTTNGNLHLDSANGLHTYINHYYGGRIYFGSGGAGGGIYTHSSFSAAGNLYLGGGGTDASHRLHVNGAGFATSDFRAPIFYDSEDTGYFLDPNGTSNLYRFGDATLNRHSLNSKQGNSPWSTRAAQGALYQTGAMGWGQNDFNVIGSNWGSGFFDTWSSPGNAPGGSSHYVGLQAFHYSNSDSSRFHGWQMACAQEATNRWFLRSAWDTPRAWVEMITTGNIGGQSVNYATQAGTASNANTVGGIGAGAFFRDLGFEGGGANANTIAETRSAFTYSNGSPHTGPLAYFGASGYGLQLNATYHGGDQNISYRVRNGDAGAWKSWFSFVTSANIGSQSVNYANSAGSAGSAPNGGNINNYYNSTAGEGYGFRFWNGDESYKISMGVGGQYQYGPVNDYSIKLHMGSGSGRGITMGITGSTPTFAHNTTNGNTQVAGTFTANNFIRVNANNNLYLDYNHGQSIVGVYSSYRYQGVYSMGDAYKLAIDGTTPGNLYGMSWSHPNAGGQASRLNDHGLMVMINGVTQSAFSSNIWAAGDITAYSDARVKDNIQVIENALEKIQSIRGVTFTRNDMTDTTTRHAGVIAQEVLEVLPEVITKDANDHYSVAYGNLNALLIEAIKEQQLQIEELKNKLDLLIHN